MPKETVYDNLFRLILNRGGDARVHGKSSGEIRPLQGKKGCVCVYACVRVCDLLQLRGNNSRAPRGWAKREMSPLMIWATVMGRLGWDIN